jgi:chemotaxis methyl-accepting protein methylase
MDLDIVAQRFDGPPFDLIVATNVLVYYSPFEQALALANIASMLRDGGWLLSNTVLPEVAGLSMEVVDVQTTTYADDGVKDVIVAYRKGRR